MYPGAVSEYGRRPVQKVDDTLVPAGVRLGDVGHVEGGHAVALAVEVDPADPALVRVGHVRRVAVVPDVQRVGQVLPNTVGVRDGLMCGYSTA